MKEVKTPRKQLVYYWIAAAAVILVLNLFVLPRVQTARVETVDYGTFMTMTEEGKIKEVQIESNAIYFTDGEDKIYRTGLMDDTGLTERLHGAGIKFSSEIVEEASPLMAIFLNWVLPLGIFYFLWSRVSKMMMDRMGGGAGSMSFGLGKSNAKVYVKSSDGIRFQDVAGEEEAKESSGDRGISARSGQI